MFAKGIAEQAAKQGADPSKVKSSGVQDDAWIKIQQKTFTNWVNSKLTEVGAEISSLETDFSDGVNVIKLLEVCSKKSFGKYNKAAKLKVHKLENLTNALKFCEKEGLTLVNIGPGDIEEGNLKLILGFLWTIIYNYQVLPSLKAAGEKGKFNFKDELLKWVNSVLCKEHQVSNFTTDWNSGIAVCCLCNAVGGKPPLIPHHAQMKSGVGDVRNNKEGIDSAYDNLSIPKLIAPEDMANPAVDEKSVMMYVSYFKTAVRKSGSGQPAAAPAPEPEPAPAPAPAPEPVKAAPKASVAEDSRPGAPKKSGKLQIYYSSTTSSRETRRLNEMLKGILERENVPGSFSTWIPLDLDEFRPLRDEIFEKAKSRTLPIMFLNGEPWADAKRIEELQEAGEIHDFFSSVDYSK